MNEIVFSPFFGIALTLFAYLLGVHLQRKANYSLMVNPMLIALIVIVSILVGFKIPLAAYMEGADYINVMLTPVTGILGLQIYRQRKVLKQTFIPIVIGCMAGCATNVVVVVGLAKVFALENNLLFSLLPRSITTPIGLSLSTQYGGIPAITMLSILLSGLIGALFSPFFAKMFRIKDKVAIGVAIGASSHALGTVTALKLGEVEGAMSSISIGVSGILTVFTFLLIPLFI